MDYNNTYISRKHSDGLPEKQTLIYADRWPPTIYFHENRIALAVVIVAILGLHLVLSEQYKKLS